MAANLRYQLHHLCDRCREGSYSTQASRRRNLLQFADQLQQLGFRKMQLTSLKTKHVDALIGHWQQQGISDKTIKNRLANLRWWAEKIGRNKIVKANNRDYQLAPTPGYNENSKALHLHSRDIANITNSYVQYSLLLQKYFGLRREEAIKFNVSYADQGDHIKLKGSWTKGGRSRNIPILTEQQRELLADIKQFVGNGSLIPSHMNYQQQLKVFEDETNKAGIHKTHGLRHAYAQNRYREITGWNAPHSGGPKQKELNGMQKVIDQNARQIIALELGHNRVRISSVYLGQ